MCTTMGEAAGVLPPGPPVRWRRTKSGGDVLSIGEWVLGRALGEGSFAVVREGRHRETGERVALKIIPKKDVTLKLARVVLREAEIGMALEHPHIVRTLDAFENPHAYVLVQALAPHGNLEGAVPAGGLAEAGAREWFRGIIRGVAHTHAAGVAHLDVKPANVLRGEGGAVKLCDYGLAMRQGGGAVIRSGTLCFAAPEIFQHTATDGYAVDMWACGVTLYYLLAGRVPWPSSMGGMGDADSVVRDILAGDGPPPPPPGASAAAADLLCRLLARDPAARPSAANVLAHPWLAAQPPRRPSVTKRITQAVKRLGRWRGPARRVMV